MKQKENVVLADLKFLKIVLLRTEWRQRFKSEGTANQELGIPGYNWKHLNKECHII